MEEVLKLIIIGFIGLGEVASEGSSGVVSKISQNLGKFVDFILGVVIDEYFFVDFVVLLNRSVVGKGSFIVSNVLPGGFDIGDGSHVHFFDVAFDHRGNGASI